MKKEIEKYIFNAFNKVYIKKLENKKYEDIPKLFNKILKIEFSSDSMKDYLKIHQYLSNIFETLYLIKKITIKKKYKTIIENFLEFICQGSKDFNYNLLFSNVVNLIITNISKDSSYFIKKIDDGGPPPGNEEKEKKELELYESIIYIINGCIKKNKDIKKIKDLKYWIIFRFAEEYFHNKNYELAEKLFYEFLYCQKGEIFDYRQYLANINIGKIKIYRKKYLEGYKVLDNLIEYIERKFEEKKEMNIEWPNDGLINEINIMKINCLIPYIESEIDEIEYINLEKYFKLLLDLLEKSRNEITNLEDIQNQLMVLKLRSLMKYIGDKLDEIDFKYLDKYFKMIFDLLEKLKDEIDIEDTKSKLQYLQMEYKKKELKNLKEKKEYKKCKELCDKFIADYHCDNQVIREIKQLKIDCLKNIADYLIRDDRKEQFMIYIKEISILQKDLDNEFGINTTTKELTDMMLKVINEKAENFNRNNLYNISENISDLGLQIDPNNIELLTEKSISNSKKGYSNINKAIDNIDKILSIHSDNISAKLNKINNISVLHLEDLKKQYIKFLIDNINNTKLIDVDSTTVVRRSIEVLIDFIKKYDNKIYSFFKDGHKNNIFPKLNLLVFCYEVKELQYESSELLKIFYTYFKDKELIIDNYTNKVFSILNKFSLTNIGWNTSGKKEIRKEDICILDIIEKIILNNNILLEIRVNILFLYSKIDTYFIAELKCYSIPLNFIEFLFKFRDDYPEYIYICLQVLLSLIKIKDIRLNDSVKEYLIEYLEKNIKNNNLMLDKADIDEYLRKNKYDESKLEFTLESIKENFKKKYYEELINKVFTEEEIDLKLLKYLKNYGIDLESIINNNKKKTKINMEIIFKILLEYINNNVNEFKIKELTNISRLFELECDLFIKDNLINLIYEISNKNDFKSDIPMKLLINLSKEIIKLSINLKDNSKDTDNSTFFFVKESLLMTNEKRINCIVDILFNFSEKIKNINTKKIDDSLFKNLCFYITNQTVTKNNKDKILKILEDNKDKLSSNIKNIYEILDKTKNLEESNSDKEKILSMINIENKIKEGYDLNINTSNTLYNIIDNNKNNATVLNQAISLINTDIINNKKIDFKLSEKIMNLFLDENVQLEKTIFDNLIICLINIVNNCKLEEQVANNLYNNLLNFNKNKFLNKIELLTISLKIFTQKHYSFNKEPILKCLYLLANESITKSNQFFKTIEILILNSFNNQNLEKEIFNALFELLYKNIDLLDCISLCLLNSLKNKEQEEINILINWNMKKLESLLLNDYFNINMIDILCKASFDIFSNSGILKSFVFFTLKLRDIKKDKFIEPLLIFYSCNKIKICYYHIKIIEDNLDLDGSFILMLKIIEIDEVNFLKKN